MQRRQHRPHGPAKVERILSFEEVRENRNFSCGVYNLCLEIVIRRRWPSFTCRPCSLWDRQRNCPHSSEPATVLALPLAGQR